jgi:predicted ester cyclase
LSTPSKQHRKQAMSVSAPGGMTVEEAREVVAPWYALFNIATRGDVREVHEQVLTEDYQSWSGYLPGECWGRDTSIKVVSKFAGTLPDMRFAIHEVLVAGNRVVVRGEVSATPSGELFGLPHTGRSFRIMAIDIQTLRGRKIAETFHMENWMSALAQLRST